MQTYSTECRKWPMTISREAPLIHSPQKSHTPNLFLAVNLEEKKKKKIFIFYQQKQVGGTRAATKEQKKNIQKQKIKFYI